MQSLYRNCQLSVAVFCVLLLSAAAARAEPVDFDIEAQSLTAALREFSQQSELQLLYSPGDVEGLSTPGVQGPLEPLDALSTLLSDTDLEVRSTGTDSVVITAPRAGTASDIDGPPTISTRQTVVEEIVVTAARREQLLSELPMSVSVLTADQLNDPQFSDFSEISNWIANTASQGGGVSTPSYAMRGMNSNAVGGRSIDLLIDGATSSDLFNVSNPALLDFERVEVIRGSQGTLYGQNSLAGTIKFVSVRPKYEQTEGEVAFSGSSMSEGDDSWQGSAVINLPLGDKVAARLGVSHEDVGGFVDRYSVEPDTFLPDELIEKDYNYTERTAFRGALSWLASDRLELYLTARYQELESPWSPIEKLRRDPPGGDSLVPFDNYTATPNDTEFREVPGPEETIATLEAVYEFESITLTSETTYYESDDGSDATIVQVIPGGLEIAQVLNVAQHQDNRSQEIRLTSRDDDPLQWIAGAYWREEEWSENFEIDNQFSNFIVAQASTLDRTQISVYGNLSYNISERVGLEAGLRWFEDDVDRSRDSQSSFGGMDLPRTTLTGSGRFDTTSPRLALRYALNDDAFVFTGVSKGFRGGTVNLLDVVAPELTSAEPDENWTYELGLKGRWLGGSLAGDVTVFYNDWDEIQTRILEDVDGQLVSIAVNGESANSHGAEWQFTWVPIDTLSFSVTGHWIDTELDSSVRGEQGPSTTGISEGNELVYAPSRSLTLRADWVRPLGVDREIYAGAHLMTRAGSYSSLSNEPVSKTSSYDQGNVKLGLRTGSWDVSAFVNNVWDERGYLVQQGAFGLDEVGFGEVISPRRVGLSLRYRF